MQTMKSKWFILSAVVVVLGGAQAFAAPTDVLQNGTYVPADTADYCNVIMAATSDGTTMTGLTETITDTSCTPGTYAFTCQEGVCTDNGDANDVVTITDGTHFVSTYQGQNAEAFTLQAKESAEQK